MINEKYLWVTRAERLHHNGTFFADTYTIHETRNTASALNERNNLQNNPGTTSFHSVVDDKEVVRCVPFTTGCYHAGTYTGNHTSLSLEICSGALENQFDKTWKNVVDVIAKDLASLGWGVDKLRQHNHWSGKDCPYKIRHENLWGRLKEDVEKRMRDMQNEKKQKTDFADARKWVIDKGISDGSNPKDTVTREQVWAMLYRMEKERGK